MQSVITSYVNPDLDGVACAIVLAATESGAWVPAMSGRLDDETKHVLSALGFPEPPIVTNWSDVERIWLVDTHHPAQLPQGLPMNRVLHITDHHPGGTPAAFPNADVKNELVGAAATLVAERVRDSVSSRQAVLLQCAILSNTLEFRAPATSERDLSAFDMLMALSPLNDTLRAEMQAVRRAALRLGTVELLLKDVKRFETPVGLVAVSQVEAEGALEIVQRNDLSQALLDVATHCVAVAAIVNVVDLASARSAVVTTHTFLDAALAAALGTSVSDQGVVAVDRVLQRKTDVIPTLLSLSPGER